MYSRTSFIVDIYTTLHYLSTILTFNSTRALCFFLWGEMYITKLTYRSDSVTQPGNDIPGNADWKEWFALVYLFFCNGLQIQSSFYSLILMTDGQCTIRSEADRCRPTWFHFSLVLTVDVISCIRIDLNCSIRRNEINSTFSTIEYVTFSLMQFSYTARDVSHFPSSF